nr:MAG TPA: hypothetical protein [Bacteriophage sp.]
MEPVPENMKVPPGPEGERSGEQTQARGASPMSGSNQLTGRSLSRWQASSQSKSV